MRAKRFYSEISVISTYCTKLLYDFRQQASHVNYFYERLIFWRKNWSKKYNHIRKGENGEREKERDRKKETWAEDRLWYLYWVHLCLFLGCVHMIFQVTVCALKYRKIAWLTLRQMQLFTKAWQKGDWTEVSLSHSLSHQSLIHFNYSQKSLKVIFIIHLQAGFAHCCARPRSCKQRRFPTCKQTRSLIYLGLYMGHLSFWRPSESVHSLLTVRLSESRHFFRPALTFCWAKNKVHRLVHTHT